MITHALAPAALDALSALAVGRRGIYRDDAAFDDLLASATAALAAEDPDTVAVIRRFAAADVPDGAVLFTGFTVDQEQMGRTPEGWQLEFQNQDRDPVTEATLLALAGTAGEIFAFARQHAGAQIQNVAPVKGHEYDAVGTGSRGLLDWHTEDAFDDAHPHYVGLLCVRGDVNADTALAPIDRVVLSPEDERILREPRFLHGIDKASGGTGRPEDGVRGPVLYGEDGERFVRVDMDCAAAVEGDEEAAAALRRVHDAADAARIAVNLKAGDLLLFDNRRVLHARTSFEPRYDGTDRWLQRVIITGDPGASAGRRTRRPRVVENDPAGQ